MCIQNFVTSRAVSFRLKDINLVVHTLLCLDDICINQLSDISIQTSSKKKKEEEIDPLELKGEHWLCPLLLELAAGTSQLSFTSEGCLLCDYSIV